MNHTTPDFSHSSTRGGMVLMLVLVVIVLLSFAVYTFSSLMLTEYTAVTTGLTHIQRRELANSGIELAALAARQNGQNSPRTGESVALHGPMSMQLPTGRQASVSLLRELPQSGQPAVFGLNDESAKLNINSLPLELSRRKESRKRLMMLPGITIPVADAILDWMDPDDEVSEFGAETSYYTSLTPPRRPGQRRFQDLRELLQVRGITAKLLYGESSESTDRQDVKRHRPFVDRADNPQRGWSEWLTVVGCESTRMPDGRSKIDLNQRVLAKLYDEVESALGKEAALYVVAFRMRGATYLDDLRPDEGDDIERRRLERLESVQKRLAAQLGETADKQSGLTADQIRRGGLTLSDGPMTFKSPLDLFGGQVRISLDGKDTLLLSPWAADPVTMRRMLPTLERILTCTGAAFLPGRININESPEVVLRTVPGVSESLARTITRIQSEARLSQRSDEFSSTAWLVSRGLVSVAELRVMGSYITTRGDVRGGIAVGQTGDDVPVAMVRFMIRSSGPDYRVLSLQDMPIISYQAAGLKLPGSPAAN